MGRLAPPGRLIPLVRSGRLHPLLQSIRLDRLVPLDPLARLLRRARWDLRLRSLQLVR